MISPWFSSVFSGFQWLFSAISVLFHARAWCKPRGVGSYEPSFDCTNRGVPPQDFWRLHGVGLNELFDSADPLVRVGEPIWRLGALSL